MLFGTGNARAAKTSIQRIVHTIEFDAACNATPLRMPMLSRHGYTVCAAVDGKCIPLFELNGSGRLIWDTCDGQHSLEHISRKLCDAFDIPLAESRRDCLNFVTRLNRKHLIRL